MKKILFAILAASLFAGCDDYKPTERKNSASEQKNPAPEKISYEDLGWAGGIQYGLVSVDGHVYLSASGVRCVSVVHAESCPCKAKK